MTRVAFAATAIAVALAACSAAHEASGPMSPAALLRDVAALVDPRLGGRPAGEDGEHAAARYIAERVARAGLAPILQDVAYGHGSTNVYAVIPGASDEVIVVGAHMDHLGVRGGELYPGADDNASGVALVLAIAETLAARATPLPRTVVVVWFGAEEHGLVGSRAFVASPPVPIARIRAMVNIDMIARPLLDQWRYRAPLRLVGIDRDAAVGLVGVRHYPALRALADAAVATGGGGDIIAAEDLPAPIARAIDAQSAGRSDSASFEAAGIPSLFFGDGESSDYHRPSDTIDELHPALFSRRTAAIERVVEALASAPASAFAASDATPPQRTPTGGWYAPIGLSTGIAHAGGRTGALLGGEASLAYLARTSLAFAGVYADALHDGAAHATRTSIGPELGSHGVGIDGGYVVELGGPHTRHGAVVRVFASASVIALSVRAGWLADGGGWFGELGVALKFPFRLTRN